MQRKDFQRSEDGYLAQHDNRRPPLHSHAQIQSRRRCLTSHEAGALWFNCTEPTVYVLCSDWTVVFISCCAVCTCVERDTHVTDTDLTLSHHTCLFLRLTFHLCFLQCIFFSQFRRAEAQSVRSHFSGLSLIICLNWKFTEMFWNVLVEQPITRILWWSS